MLLMKAKLIFIFVYTSWWGDRCPSLMLLFVSGLAPNSMSQVNTSRNLMLSSSVPITTKSSSVNLNCLPVCQLFECSWNVLIWENLLCNSYCHYMYFISPSVCRREGYNSPITSRYHVLLYILLIHIFNHVSYLIPLITPGHTLFSN